MSAAPPSAPPPPPPPPAGAARPDGRADGATGDGPASTDLVRRTGDRVVAGVAAALGRRWDVDPVLVRILFAITTFAAGVGVIAYVVFWIALPLVDAPAPANQARSGPRGLAFWVGAAAITIAGIITLSGLQRLRIIVPLVLITLGVALWQRPGGSGTAPGRQDVAGESPVDPGAWSPPPVPGRSGVAATSPGSPTSGQLRGGWAGQPAAVPATSSAPESRPVPEVRWWMPPEARRRPSWLGPITVAIALVATGTVALLGEAGVLRPSSTDLVSMALLVLGGGLVVGAFRGRAKWLALPATVLAAFVFLGQADVPFDWPAGVSIGSRTISPSALDGGLEVRQGIGEVMVDLSDTMLGDGDGVDVAIGAGTVRVMVPDDVTVELTGRIGAGTVRTVAPLQDPGSEAGEVAYAVAELEGDLSDQPFAHRLATDVPSGRTLFLDVQGGLVEVEVLRGVSLARLRDGGGSLVDPPDDGDVGALFVPEDWDPDLHRWWLETLRGDQRVVVDVEVGESASAEPTDAPTSVPASPGLPTPAVPATPTSSGRN